MKGIEAYTRMIIETLALKPGMCLNITGEPEHREFIEAFAEAAYTRGAKYVSVDISMPGILKTRLTHSSQEHLSFFPSWIQEEYRALIDENWAVLSLTGKEDPDLLMDADPVRVGIIQKASAKLRENYLAAISANKITWCVTGIPTDGWARKVFGRPDASKEDLWEILYPIYRLHTPSPIEALRDHASRLKERCAGLNALGIDRLEFKAPGTDVSIGLLKESRWLGGTGECVDGRTFFPNIPSEEVFTTPDYRQTRGTITLTRPVPMMGSSVEGAWFEFEEGKVCDYGAVKGKEILDEYFAIDPQARYLGEVALVEEGNPVGTSGLIFHNILFDENAACHIALGNGYTDAVDGLEQTERDGLLAKGVNTAPVHTDLMFGCPELDVDCVNADGTRIPVMRKGRFVSL
ncbi:MAG: aminopeptidase [Spirochaetales bacterium]|nr:aminopeptidase [Spirochaetales bacterium]